MIQQTRKFVMRESADKLRQLRGVSAVTTLKPHYLRMDFISAGYDHVFHHWSIDPREISPPESRVLSIKHKSLVQSILNRDNYLLSGGADNIVQRWDLNMDALSRKLQTSNSVYQLHSPCHRDCVLLEV